MPTYLYKCDHCAKTHEIFQKINDDALTCCPECGKEGFRRIPSKEVSFQFKGSGFYLTDYGNKSGEKPSDGCTGTGSCGHCKS